MARAALTVHDLSAAGVTTTGNYTTITADGVSVANNGSAYVIVHVKATTACTLTISTNYTVDGLSLPDKTVALNAGAEWIGGPFSTRYYNQTGNLIYIDSNQLDTQIIALSHT